MLISNYSVISFMLKIQGMYCSWPWIDRPWRRVACSDLDGGEDGEQDRAAGNTRAWHTCFVIHAHTLHILNSGTQDTRERERS